MRTAEPLTHGADIDSRSIQRRERLTMPHPAHLPCAGYRAGVPPHVAKTMQPRRTARLLRSAPLFRLERTQGRLANLGCSPCVKLSGVVCVRALIEFLAGPYLHDQARGCSRYFPRPLFLYSMQGIHALHAKAAQALACAAHAAASPENLAAAPHCSRCLDGFTQGRASMTT